VPDIPALRRAVEVDLQHASITSAVRILTKIWELICLIRRGLCKFMACIIVTRSC
jgi:hypothetical protein